MSDWFVWLDRALGTFCLGAFVWAAIFHFKHPIKYERWKTVISLSALNLTLLSLFVLFTTWPVNLAALVSAFFLFFFSTWLFLTAIKVSRHKLDFAFSISQPTFVISSGPYRLIRHPFYLAYSLAWTAGSIFSSSLTIICGSLWMFYLYFQAARYEEKNLLASAVSHEYREYQGKTKMFIPFLI